MRNLKVVIMILYPANENGLKWIENFNPF